MVLYLRELARNRKSFIIWTIALLLSDVLMMFFFPTVYDQSKSFNEILRQFPEALASALKLNVLNFGDVLNYFAYVFQYIILFSGIFAMMFGAGALSREEDEKTVEFLMAKPVTRNYIVSAKLLAVLTYLVLFNIIMAAGNFIAFEAVKKESYSVNLLLTVIAGNFLAQVTFAATGFLISVFVVKSKSVLSVSLGVVLGTYFLSIAAGISDKLENLKYLTPFEYVSPAVLVTDGRIEVVYLIIMVCVILLSTALTYSFYNRKNITA
ncbi:MAG TPA: ABC transporter permease subunit [Clostridiaceae bacterium]|nr:ABC transporter permease subunit [Clostridiaceae bacterium]